MNRRGSWWLAVAAAFALVASTSSAAAQSAELPPAEPEAPRLPSPAAGRGFTWGAFAATPIWLGELRYAESGIAVPYFALGGGPVGRIGAELPGGLVLEVIIAIHGHSVDHMIDNRGSLVGYRAGLGARWMIDTGSPLVPFLGGGGSVLFLNRGGSLGTTGVVHAMLGAQWILANWVALELGVEGALVFPGAALSDVAGYLSPQIGASFYFE